LPRVWIDEGDGLAEQAFLIRPGGDAVMSAVAQIDEMAQQRCGVRRAGSLHDAS
jgi:hypothetical protein